MVLHTVTWNSLTGRAHAPMGSIVVQFKWSVHQAHRVITSQSQILPCGLKLARKSTTSALTLLEVEDAWNLELHTPHMPRLHKRLQLLREYHYPSSVIMLICGQGRIHRRDYGRRSQCWRWTFCQHRHPNSTHLILPRSHTSQGSPWLILVKMAQRDGGFQTGCTVNGKSLWIGWFGWFRSSCIYFSDVSYSHPCI